MKSVYLVPLVLILAAISRADMSSGMKHKRAYGDYGLGYGYAHAPVVAAHAPLVHHTVAAAAPVAYHAPVAKYATSYVTSSINHGPIIAAAHAPVVAHAAPVVAHAAPVITHAAPVVGHASVYHHDPYLPAAYHQPLPYYYHRR
ncbi:hypothetical protein DMENIID0001_077730 [Sergentomyia squamirostris]